MQKFCTEKVTAQMDLFNSVPWRFYVISNASEDYNYILGIAHHSYTDAVQYLSAVRAVSTNKPEYNSVPGLPAWKLAIGNLFSPFYMIKRSID